MSYTVRPYYWRDQTSEKNEARSSNWRKKIDKNETSRDAKGVATEAVFKEKQSMISSEFRLKARIRSEARVHLQAFVLCIVDEQSDH
uniref:Uncharacterized protein n=1 Tax=Romanomermis culicivorax TaxID=13658 RepID=A0A915K9J2_ROMCU